jgi:hypothetical protein
MQFGRYSDFYKDRSKNEFWDKALQCHESKNFLAGIKHFLNYLSDETQDNIEIKELPEKLLFTISQGSKKIEGFANQDSFFAEIKIAKCLDLQLGILRSLMEENYGLQYSCFALDSDNNITLILHTEYEEATPYKLYYGLKEMATRADKKDDILIANYTSLEEIELGQISHQSHQIKEAKYKYFFDAFSKTCQAIDADFEKLKIYPALLNYRIMAVCLSTDYLLKPEGLLSESIEKIFKINFNTPTLNIDQKHRSILKELKATLKREREEVEKEFYETKHTFGWLSSGNHLRLKEMIDQEMAHADWYIDNGYKDYVDYIPQYIASFLLYNYAMPLPDKMYLHLILKVYNNDLFLSLGFESLFKKNGELNKSFIVSQIKDIEEKNKELYLGFKDITSDLIFNSKYEFSTSLLHAIYKLEIKKIKSL